MSFYVKVNECEIRCETASEAMALAAQVSRNRFAQTSSTQGKPARTSHTANGRVDPHKRAIVDQSLKFLTAVKENSAEGIGGDELVKNVGCSTKSALGTVVANTRRLLAEARIDFDQVVQKRRVGDSKMWFPAALIEKGIVALKEKGIELSNDQ